MTIWKKCQNSKDLWGNVKERNNYARKRNDAKQRRNWRYPKHDQKSEQYCDDQKLFGSFQRN